MFSKSSLFCLTLAASNIIACSSADEQAGQPSAPDGNAPATSTDALLAKVDVGYGTIEFHKKTAQSGEAVYGIAETASAYATSTPLQVAVGQDKHTMLEVFKAVAPNQQPPQELVDNHPSEAKLLGRDSDALQVPAFDQNKPIEKSIQACRNWVYAPPDPAQCVIWGNFLEYTTAGSEWLPVGVNTGDWGHNTMARVTMGVCNDTPTPTLGQVAWSVDNGAWNYDPAVSIDAYTVYHWWEYYQSYSGPGCSGSPICVPIQHPGRYGVHQLGGPVDVLMTGEEVFNNACIK